MIVNSYGREAVSNPFLVAHICDGELTWFHPDMTDDQIAHCREKLNFLNRRKHDKGNNS